MAWNFPYISCLSLQVAEITVIHHPTAGYEFKGERALSQALLDSLMWVGITWPPEWCLYNATNFLTQRGPQLLCFTCEKSRSLGSENLEDFSGRYCHQVLKRNENVPDVTFLPGIGLHLQERWPNLFLFSTFVLVFILRQCLSQVVYIAEDNFELVILWLHFP